MMTLTLKSIKTPSLPIPGADPWYAHSTDPALSVMTDFRERSSVLVSENATIDAALDHMKHTGVRCAFAIDDERRVVVGLITAYDIASEKPMRHMLSMASKRGEVLVKDIMLPPVEWHSADIKDIERLTVAAVARAFDESQLTHIPVVEKSEKGDVRLRGLLSAARIRRLLSREVGPRSAVGAA